MGSWKEKNQITIEGNGFYNHLFNQITLAQINGLNYTYVNIGEFETFGVRSQISYSLSYWQFSLGYSELARTNIGQIENQPKVNLSLEINTTITFQSKNKQWRGSLFYKYNGRQTSIVVDDKNQISNTFVSPYQLLDLNFTYITKNKKWQFGSGIKNLYNITTILTSGSTGVHAGGSNNLSIGTGRTLYLRLHYAINS